MAEDKLGKNDIAAVFKRLRGIPGNKVCFDCGAKNPTWASVTYGVFICIDCSAVHRSLGVHLSFVRSTQLDTWTWLQLRAMQVGGNANALSFFHQHGVTSTDSQQKYNSRTAQMYREKLHQQATAAIRSHGTKLHIELPHAETATSPDKKDVDFFEDITQAHISSPSSNSLQNGSANNVNNNQSNDYNKEESLLCPKVDALNISPSDCQIRTDVRKSTITGRKASSNKKTLGGRIGLGAQKVSTNFTDIEKEAQRIDELRRQTEKLETEKSEKSQADEDLQRASIRLAYKDISQRQKEAENKMKNLDPRRAEQMERLGIGFGTNNIRTSNAVSHSVASEMKLITQENVKEPSKTSDLDLEDDFEFFSFTSGPPKYGDSPFLTRSASDRLGDFSGKSSWSSDRQDKKTTSEIMPSPQKDTSGRSRKFTPVASPVTDEAQKKFGNARAISSEQYFGPNRDVDFERRTNLTRFEGSNSISSEDYFGGNGSVPRSASASSFSGPNLYEIKEGVRDGVTKVAGRLSSLANGMMNSIQDRYGI